MDLLINRKTISNLLQTSVGVSDDVVANVIREAQEIDLRDKVCEDFYSDLIANKNDANWKLVYQGGSYTHESKTYYSPGLNKILAYWSYARLLEKGNSVSTSFGFVRKNSPQSESLTQGELERMSRTFRRDADQLWREFDKYMCRNSSTFTNWGGEMKGTMIKTRVLK